MNDLSGLRSGTVDRYKTQYCHVLALAIYRLTGWPMQALWGVRDGQHVLLHLFTRCPHDPAAGLDALGCRSLAEIAATFPDVARTWTTDVSQDEFKRWIFDEARLGTFSAEDVRGAAELAKRLVARLQTRTGPVETAPMPDGRGVLV